MKRLVSYRFGDHAENLGIVLMQMFCAIAPVPRQEDFGIFDAVATLLCREGKFWRAEGSFLVQFKSRTERVVQYKGEKFKSLLDQELGLFIAQVNLQKADIKLYSIGVALSNPNIYHACNLMFHLTKPRKPIGLDGNTLHVAPDPVLHWSAQDIATSEKADNAYEVMAKWLELDRQNRRYHKIGRQVQIRWETNEVPSPTSTSITMNQGYTNLAPADVVPTVETLGQLAFNAVEPAKLMIQVISWLRSRNFNSAGLYSIQLQLWQSVIQNLICLELTHNDNADFGVFIKFDVNAPGSYIFWEYLGGTQNCHGNKHQCSNLDEIYNLGFEVDMDSTTQVIVEITLGESWQSRNQCELLEERNNVFLLKTIAPVDPTLSLST